MFTLLSSLILFCLLLLFFSQLAIVFTLSFPPGTSPSDDSNQSSADPQRPIHQRPGELHRRLTGESDGVHA